MRVRAADDAFAASNPWGGATYKGVRIDEDETAMLAPPAPAPPAAAARGAAEAPAPGPRVSRFDRPPADECGGGGGCGGGDVTAGVAKPEPCGAVEAAGCGDAEAACAEAPAVAFKRRNMGGGDARKRRRADDD